MTVEERRAFVREYIARQRAEDEMIYRCVAIPQLWVEVEKAVPEDEVLTKFVRSCCAAGIRYCCVLYEGTVYPCMVLQEKAGDVRERSFVDIWRNSEVFVLFSNMLNTLQNHENPSLNAEHTICCSLSVNMSYI